MLRSTFFSAGLFVFLWGISFLFVDQVVFKVKDESAGDKDKEVRGMFMSVTPQNQKAFNPPEWCAFSLMSVGSVTMLYAVALPKR